MCKTSISYICRKVNTKTLANVGFYILHKKKVFVLAKVPHVNMDKIRTLSDAAGIKMKFFCDTFGRQRSFMTDVKNGKTFLSEEQLLFVADKLNTTVEYLTDKTEQKEKPTADNSGELNENVERVLDKLMKMHPEDIEKTIAFADWLAAQRDE